VWTQQSPRDAKVKRSIMDMERRIRTTREVCIVTVRNGMNITERNEVSK